MRRTLLALALLATPLTACNDNSLAPQNPRIKVSPSEILFEPTLAGASNTKTATVKNDGGGILRIESMELGGASPADYLFDASAGGTFPIALGPGEWFALQVTFAPGQTIGDHTGVLTVFSNDGAHPALDVPLITPALGPDIDAQPNPLAFGVVTVNQTVTQGLTISNTGTADLDVSGAALGAGSSSTFGLMTGGVLPATIAPGASIVLPVTYHPTAATSDSGTVEIASNDPDENPAIVPISGNATTNPVPDINASPNTINFGDVQRLTCLTKTTMVQNVGAAPLNVSNITRGFLTSLEYTFTPTNFTVAPGGNQVLSVTFCPADTGLDFGSLSVSSNDPDENPYSINLLGNGTAPPLAATDIAVEVTWDKNNTDVDTHFMRPGGTFNSNPGDVYYLNLSPDWGMAGNPNDDPYLDYDDVDGFGPENLNYAGPVTGTYRLAMYYYSDNGLGGTNTTVKVYLNGVLAYQTSKVITNHQRWDVVDIAWNAGTDTGTYTVLGTVTQLFTFGPDTK